MQAPQLAGEKGVVTRKPYTISPESKARRIEKTQAAMRQRWMQKYQGIDPTVAAQIYRDGYQAGFTQARLKGALSYDV